MNKAGGTIALVAGVFGTLAGIVTLLVGGLGSAFNASGADTVVGLGWGGIAFSFFVIVFGAVAFHRPKGAGIGLIVCSLGGAILGGTIVAVFMCLSLIGGIVCLVGGQKNRDTATVAGPQFAPDQTNATYSQLERLADLKAKGILSDAEFAAQKQRLLSGCSSIPEVQAHPAASAAVAPSPLAAPPRPRSRRWLPIAIGVTLAFVVAVIVLVQVSNRIDGSAATPPETSDNGQQLPPVLPASAPVEEATVTITADVASSPQNVTSSRDLVAAAAKVEFFTGATEADGTSRPGQFFVSFDSGGSADLPVGAMTDESTSATLAAISDAAHKIKITGTVYTDTEGVEHFDGSKAITMTYPKGTEVRQ